MDILTVEKTKQWMQEILTRMEDNQEQLNGLDLAIGDGDHGINMANGFRGVVEKISGAEYDSVSDVLKSVSITVKAKAGDTSGALYGKAFLEMAIALQDKEVTPENLSAAVKAASEGIQQEGNAEIGEKTLYDVWYLVADFLAAEEAANWGGMTEACQATIEDTREMIAKQGRAAQLRENSIGHVDPGSMSSFYIFDGLVTVMGLENEAVK